ncbi:DUF5776 domain-containing protein [Lentilactobacillus hilgardii]|jgi:hypothetical protein|uniref:Exo-alpha-sialidase n=1 Tax=Lentilactobacillus hilgardii TaxID=1588 RepID=A0A6P1E3E8_LENHI|nr:DUF5776 domain-containing protein [Lentilactobacillus hilgardii]EEI72077.1 BNR/Asp-box repeat protein [Lentilactobacillus hilgardii ATCC 27305]MCT3392416.1 exo-alpha-sialidase [Lentilactobacillus hilgardii]QHB51059.1 exo-alpha-sialidase [Lentilactobacillus hilgardii]RRG11771.1 MAG: exo-alpha-sialidase [Lactobacillus sp.]
MVKISHILGTAVAAVTLLFTFSVTSKADTKPAAIDPVTVYQAKNDGSGFLNGKNYGALSPRVIQLKHQANSADNGKLLMTFEQVITNKAGETGHPVFPIYESDDNGATWKQVGQVTETNNKDWGKLNCPQLYELPQTIGDMTKGTIVVAGDATPNDRSATDLELDKSTDGGKTWTYESTIAQSGGNFLYGDPVWEPYLMVYDNKLVCYYSDERDSSGLPAKSQAIVHQTTTDGKTWSPIVFDANPTKLTNKDQRPGMPIVTQMSNGEWVMTYEQFGGGSSGAKFSKDPLNFDQADPGTTIAPSGAPYITTLNNGELAFNNNGNGGKVFIFKDKTSLLRGTYHPDATFTPKSGQAYNRQLLPLANGMLLVANGGGTGNTPNAIKVETLDASDTVQQGKVVIHYVDENGKQIKPDDTTTVGTVGTKYDVTDKTKSSITGYQLKGVTQGQNNLAGNFGADPIEITVTYTTSNSGSGSTVTPPASSSSSSSSSSAVTSSSSSSTEASSSSNVTESSSSTTTPEASTTKKVTPFKIIAKKALYRYNSTTFSKANRIKGYAKKSITKAPVFKVVGTAKSANGALRYQLSDGSYVTAKAGYTVKLYLTKNVKALKVINAKGTWTYKTTKATKKNAVKHLKKGTIVKTKKIVKSGSTTKYQLTNGYYITGSRQYVKAQF